MTYDPILGKHMHGVLVSKGVETPMKEVLISKDEQRAILEDYSRGMLEALGMDLTDDSLIDTPKRVAKMYINEIFYGLDYNLFPKCTTVENKMGYNEMITVSACNISSFCEHHLISMVGKAYISYIPQTKVLGLSKFPRIVDFFARRPQIQERLTEQTYFSLADILETEDVAVTMICEHMCVSQRGVKDTSSFTTTAKLGGCFKEFPHVRAEYLNHIYSPILHR
jgi:GTP cyclohydrolase I